MSKTREERETLNKEEKYGNLRWELESCQLQSSVS